MLPMTDSFIEYLNTAGLGVPVHWVRVTDEADDNTLKMDHLNVSILGTLQEGSLEETLISLDLIATSERQAYTRAEAVIAKLRERQYIPELSYSLDPASPTATGKMVSWEADKTRFQVVEASPLYLHLNATFHICHAR